MKSHWREHAREVITKVMQDTAGQTDQEVKKAISAAYPFGQRRYHPYKIWLSEVGIALKKKRANSKYRKPDPNQGDLFKTEK